VLDQYFFAAAVGELRVDGAAGDSSDSPTLALSPLSQDTSSGLRPPSPHPMRRRVVEAERECCVGGPDRHLSPALSPFEAEREQKARNGFCLGLRSSLDMERFYTSRADAAIWS